MQPQSSHKPSVALTSGGWLFLLSLMVSAGVAFFANARSAPPQVRQPIVFNHKKHVEEQELECSACHRGAEHDIHSGLPSGQMCALCHSEAQGESAEEHELVKLLEEGRPLEWGRLFRQPPHVFFSHRRHVVVAGLECAACHGTIGLSIAPPDRAQPLKMDQCISCHTEQGASLDCGACHR